jgi:hypothetical protein
MSQVVVAAMLLVLTAGCAPECKKQAQRCFNGVAQLCDAGGKWQDVMECDQVTPGKWECTCDPKPCACRRPK